MALSLFAVIKYATITDLLLSRPCDVVDPYKIYPVHLHSIRCCLRNIPNRLSRIFLIDRREILLCRYTTQRVENTILYSIVLLINHKEIGISKNESRVFYWYFGFEYIIVRILYYS